MSRWWTLSVHIFLYGGPLDSQFPLDCPKRQPLARGSPGGDGGRHEHTGCRPDVRPAPGHRAMDAGLLRAAGVPETDPAPASQAGALQRRHRQDSGGRPQVPRKQRHTAKRIYERLRDEYVPRQLLLPIYAHYSCLLPHPNRYSTKVVASNKMLPKTREAATWAEASARWRSRNLWRRSGTGTNKHRRRTKGGFSTN